MGYDYSWVGLSTPRFELVKYHTEYKNDYDNRLASKLDPIRTVNHDEKIKLEKLGLRYFNSGSSWGFMKDDIWKEDNSG